MRTHVIDEALLTRSGIQIDWCHVLCEHTLRPYTQADAQPEVWKAVLLAVILPPQMRFGCVGAYECRRHFTNNKRGLCTFCSIGLYFSIVRIVSQSANSRVSPARPVSVARLAKEQDGAGLYASINLYVKQPNSHPIQLSIIIFIFLINKIE